jgi:drug/metabolite transporter (DMT)-like permease
MMPSSKRQAQGLNAALASALFLGLAPVFGKMAILSGMPWTAVVSLRTLFATFLLFLVLLIFRRSFLYIYPAGLAGCFLAGLINGAGSLLYYSGLARIDASLGQSIYSLYPLFVGLWLWMDHQLPGRLTLTRMALILPALFLLTQIGRSPVDLAGVLMMLASAALYALHLPINQRVLYDMPAPTVTFYTLLAMSMTVFPALFFQPFSLALPSLAWGGVLSLTLVTFLSRLTLFVGVKHIGGAQTALLGLSELLVTLLFSYFLLGDRLTSAQWGGVVLLVLILMMAKFEKPIPGKASARGWLAWLRSRELPGEKA